MPVNIFGEWIAPVEKGAEKKPVKVRLVKRGQNWMTHILNLNRSTEELALMASSLKKQLGSGGCVKGDEIEIQGDKVDQVKRWLEALGIKAG